MQQCEPASFKVLVVGGGIAGMTSALALRRQGVNVDLIDLDPEWRVYGAGITVTRPTMRAFRDLGLLDDLLAAGFPGNGIRVCEADGREIEWIKDPDIPGDPLPGSGGVMRPELHHMLSARVRTSGTAIRLGVSVEKLVSSDDRVDVVFTDGTSHSYDLVLGADGVFSKVRELILPDAPKPTYTGQMVWRLHAPRPAKIDRRHFFLGGPYKVGICPVSDSHLYLFLLEPGPRRPIMPDAALPGELSRLMQGYGGTIAELRENLGPESQIVLRPLEAFLLVPPWHRGRVLLIGDAAHPTTPQLASGAGMAVEDSIVLSRELARNGWNVPQALDAFMRRRWERCRLVVENSIEIGLREQAGRSIQEQTDLVTQSLAKLAEPI